MSKFTSVGNYLKAARKENNMTQEELASVLDIHPQYVSNYERGICLPPHDKMKTLSKALKLRRYDKEILLDSIVESYRGDIVKSYRGIL